MVQSQMERLCQSPRIPFPPFSLSLSVADIANAQNTWEPEDNLKHLELYAEYERERKRKASQNNADQQCTLRLRESTSTQTSSSCHYKTRSHASIPSVSSQSPSDEDVVEVPSTKSSSDCPSIDAPKASPTSTPKTRRIIKLKLPRKGTNKNRFLESDDDDDGDESEDEPILNTKRKLIPSITKTGDNSNDSNKGNHSKTPKITKTPKGTNGGKEGSPLGKIPKLNRYKTSAVFVSRT